MIYTGHGWVVPRLDGTRARCGGPAICRVCSLEAAQYRIQPAAPKPSDAGSALLNYLERLDMAGVE